MAPCKSLSSNTSLSTLLSSLSFHNICPCGGFKGGTADPEGGARMSQLEIDEGWRRKKSGATIKKEQKSGEKPETWERPDIRVGSRAHSDERQSSINKSLQDTDTRQQERWQSRCGCQGEPPVILELGNRCNEDSRIWRQSDEHHLVDSVFTPSHLTVHYEQKACTLLGIFIGHHAGLRFRVRRSLSAQTGFSFTTRLLTIKCHPEQSGVSIFLAAFTPLAFGGKRRTPRMDRH